MNNTVSLTCPICGKSYQANPQKLKHGRQSTCSRECSYIYRGRKCSTATEVHCSRCGKPFSVTPSKLQRGRQYCSTTCAFPPLIKTCIVCGNTFRTPPSANAMFCSPQCCNASEYKSQQSRQSALNNWRDPVIRTKTLEGIARRSLNPAWRNAAHFQRGSAHPRFKINKQGRLQEGNRYRYKKWRSDVLKRDNYTCQSCGLRGGKLTAHHIKAWAEYPDSRYDVDNGLTLCCPCHDQIHGRKPRIRVYTCEICGATKADRRSCRCRSCAKKYGAAPSGHI